MNEAAKIVGVPSSVLCLFARGDEAIEYGIALNYIYRPIYTPTADDVYHARLPYPTTDLFNSVRRKLG